MITNPRACSAIRPYRPDRQPSTQARNLTEPWVRGTSAFRGVELPVHAARRGLVPTLWCAGRVYASPMARTLPTSCWVAGRRFFEPGGLPGPGRDGFGALAGVPGGCRVTAA